jgi:hypothetical protein
VFLVLLGFPWDVCMFPLLAPAWNPCSAAQASVADLLPSVVRVPQTARSKQRQGQARTQSKRDADGGLLYCGVERPMQTTPAAVNCHPQHRAIFAMTPLAKARGLAGF